MNIQEIKAGQKVSFYGSIGRGIKIVKHVCGEVTAVSEKAVQIEEISGNNWVKTWVPKSAIKNIDFCHITDTAEGDLKAWFVKK
jgi:hypothetical protein